MFVNWILIIWHTLGYIFVLTKMILLYSPESSHGLELKEYRVTKEHAQIPTVNRACSKNVNQCMWAY